MLDTVSIRLTYPDFKVTNPTLFKPALYIQPEEFSFNNQDERKGFKKHIQNSKLKDEKIELYMPRLTAYERLNQGCYTYDLHIEFSIPKLLFGNNLQELENDDLEKTITILKERLKRMAIEVTEDALLNAIVTKAHFGKNIPLLRPTTVQDAISELYKADVGKVKDTNIRHYGNGGEALYFYTSSANIIFYDKLKDMENTKTRALDKDRLRQEKFLLQEIDSENRPEILRFEFRLARQYSLNAFTSRVLKEKIEYITFEKIFNKEFCQKILLACWKKIIDRPASQLALKMDRPIEEIFDAMVKDISPVQKKKAHSLNKALASLGLYILINQYGARETRNKIEKNWSNKSWNRLSEKIKESATKLRALPPSHAVSDVQSALEKFEKYDF